MSESSPAADAAAGERSSPPEILVAGVGHLHVGDLAVGPLTVEGLLRESWPDHVLIEDFSYGPVGVMHRLDEIGAEWRRMIFIGAQERGRPPGVYEIDWSAPDLQDEEIQARFEAGATGIIDLENFLVVASRFGKLSGEVLVIEIEPEDTSWGERLSSVARQALEHIPARVRQLVD